MLIKRRLPKGYAWDYIAGKFVVVKKED